MKPVTLLVAIGVLLGASRVAGSQEPGASTYAEASKLFEAGKFGDAADAALRVTEESPEFARSRYLAGEALLISGDLEGAEGALREALERKEGSEPVLTALGHVLIERDRPGEAIPLLERAVKANDKSARARAWLGLARARDGETEKARAIGRRDLAAAVKLAPTDPEVVRAAVAERIDAQDPDGALKLASAFARLRKDSPVGPFLVGLSYDRDENDPKAIEHYEKAIAIDDTYLDAHKNLAILCIEQTPSFSDEAQTRKAFAHFKRYVALGGKDQEVIRNFEILVRFDAANGGSK